LGVYNYRLTKLASPRVSVSRHTQSELAQDFGKLVQSRNIYHQCLAHCVTWLHTMFAKVNEHTEI